MVLGMQKHMLLIASAPLDAVCGVAARLGAEYPEAEFSMLVRRTIAEETGGRLPGFRVFSYDDGALDLKVLDNPQFDELSCAASDGVVYVCGNNTGEGYLNVEIVARCINLDDVRAVSPPFMSVDVVLPARLKNIIEGGGANRREEFIGAIPEWAFLKSRLKESVATMSPGIGPRRVHLSVSTACNYKCVMCAFHSPRNVGCELPPEWGEIPVGFKQAENLRKDVMKLEHFVSIIDDLSEMGTETIVLTGFGEPLVNRHIDEMLRYISGRGMGCNIVTNGLLLDEKNREAMIAARVDVVHVSLNSASPDVYSKIHTNMPADGFNQVVSNIKALDAARRARGLSLPRIGVSYVLSSLNVHEIGRMLALAEECGADYIALTPVFVFPQIMDLKLESADIAMVEKAVGDFKSRSAYTGTPQINTEFDMWNPDALPTKELHSEIPCYMGWVFAQITSWGDVRPCCSCSSVLGNAVERPFSEVWNSPAYVRMRERMKALPGAGRPIETCGCYSCGHGRENRVIHRQISS